MAQLTRFSWTEPELCRATNGWFVYFEFTDHLSSRTIRKQFRGGINRIKNKDERIKQGNALRLYWRRRLENGYNPICEDSIGIAKMPYHYTTSEALERILQAKLPSLRKRTKETYTYMVKVFTEWLAAKKYDDLLMGELTPAICSEYFDYLVTEKKYAGRTHNDHLIVLKTLTNEMIEREWFVKSPFRKIKPRETTVGRNLAYTDEEMELLRKHLKSSDRRLYYFTQFLYYCFIRRTELTGLRVGDIDLVNHTITIPAQVSKNKTQESVVIPVGLEPILKEMDLGKCHPDHYLFGCRLITGSKRYVNANHISTRHTTKTKGLISDSDKGLYSWKHSGVCKAYYATGKDIYALMRQLRHRDLNTTQIYLKSLGLVNNDAFRLAMVG